MVVGLKVKQTYQWSVGMGVGNDKCICCCVANDGKTRNAVINHNGYSVRRLQVLLDCLLQHGVGPYRRVKLTQLSSVHFLLGLRW